MSKIPFCEAKQRTCPAAEFIPLSSKAPLSFELNDLLSQTKETLDPCDSCSYKTIGKAALAMKSQMESGVLAELLDVVEDPFASQAPVTPCDRCPEYARRELPDSIVDGKEMTALEYYGADYFLQESRDDEARAPYVRICPGKIESKTYDDYEDGPTYITVCGAAALLACTQANLLDEGIIKPTIRYS